MSCVSTALENFVQSLFQQEGKTLNELCKHLEYYAEELNQCLFENFSKYKFSPVSKDDQSAFDEFVKRMKSHGVQASNHTSASKTENSDHEPSNISNGNRTDSTSSHSKKIKYHQHFNGAIAPPVTLAAFSQASTISCIFVTVCSTSCSKE